MDCSPGSTSSSRRRRAVEDSPSAMMRTASNNSSKSSDEILVAGPAHHTPAQRHKQAVPSHVLSHSRRSSAKITTARVVYNRLTISFGPALARERFRGIVRTSPKHISRASDTSDSTSSEVKSEDEEVSEGPNHRGTYAKEYTLLHPRVTWVHRGQGRYLPASAIANDSPSANSRPTRYGSCKISLVVRACAKLNRQTTERTNGSVATSEQTMEKMTQALYDQFGEWRRQRNPEASDRWSPQLKGQYKLYLEMIKTTPRQQWSKVIETIVDEDHKEVVRQWNRVMDRRFPTNGKVERQHSEDSSPRNHLSRQAKNSWPSLEHRRSSRLTDAPNNGSYNEDDCDGEDSDDSRSPDKTHRKEYVDAHPNEVFYHAGNGWWKRGSKPSESEKASDRRDSSASHAMKYSSSEASRELDAGATIHKEDLHKYPGMTFHHKGNRWYKPGIGPNGVTGCITVSAGGRIIGPKRRRSDLTADSSERVIDGPPPLSALDEGHTVNRAYADLHPEVEWVHRGGGRYKRKASLIDTGTITPAGSSDRRSSRAENRFSNHYAGSHTSDELRRSGNRRRNSNFESPDDEPGELVDRRYVDAHPSEKFYHRGQGRYARGDRPKPLGSPVLDHSHSEEKFDRAYVDAHPNETFHHRGQGRWARGLPPPNSNSKTAVRGPGVLEMYRREKSPNDGPRPPLLTALLRKEEGPDLWPNLSWQYRGGGKWCQVSKEEAQRLTAKPRKTRLSTGRNRSDEADTQLRGEALAMDGSSVVVKRFTTLLPKPARLVRKRSRQSTAQSPSNPQSNAPTPRPALLPEEEDRMCEQDLPGLYKDVWSDTEWENLDEAAKILRREFAPIIGAEPFVAALTKHDPAIRSLTTLKALAANTQRALMQLQDEYLALDDLVARHPMNGKKERKAVKGGRQPLEHTVWEDRKEAVLYDYTYDPRKIGYQDPDAQRIVRDEEGRELRRRRNRYGHDPHETAVNYGDGEMTAKRAVKPVSRFDGVVIPPPRKRSRLMPTTVDENSAKAADETPSATPNRAASPIPGFTEAEMAAINDPKRGRWMGHIPKAMHHRLRELRGESVGSQRSDGGGSTGSPNPTGVRKGRPPGSKNLKPRKDIGIKKGPRKKPATSQATPSSSAEPETMQDMTVPMIVEDPPDDMPAAAAADELVAIDAATNQPMPLNV
ncbi:hypothetical protein DOTSEDRAFT_42906 [Dothistroma septosporum NZE10]|uniref:Uncharacterized protein n=1 Tax=Dothistroma septosporum (strain NZE10 / CBS 128990) TaxID=675120 RepID=N1PSF5_DOTSN|nr:hypothetical protein DOTSEDRAFT_42906 [Dothistroma septosporum NZE10]